MTVWIEAARPKTLSAAVAPVAVGTGAAVTATGAVILWRVLAALVVALAVQVAVNYANDYFDGVRGVDSQARVGPRRAVAAGLVPAERMRAAMLAAFGVAGVAGLALAAAVGWELLAVGLACFAAAAAYSGGPRPYASAGLGEVFVFVFFGLVATAGTAYVLVERLTLVAVVAAIPVGMLAVAILVANNLRDLASDAAGGKRTLAVRMGDRPTRLLYAACVLSAFLFLPVIAAVMPEGVSAWPLLALVSLLPALPPMRATLWGASGRDLIPVLVGTSRTHLLFGLTLAASLALA
ncbi:MAG: 1,4-dihydroxy-2-naphthoate polyprenyltransferase [Nitriliruptorales bacterium]|nr:1,4-dihydroxy-2-naphthoate polyprenyltransferase [Nitriliruptorales bacterium]